MPSNPEAPFPKDYRAARKTFIAACEKARTDSIARVHPISLAPDGKPLFLDSAALGPRDAGKALLVIADGASASTALTALLNKGVALPDGAKLVLLHAFDPFAFACVKGNDRNWSRAMLAAVAREDLARVKLLKLLVLDANDAGLIKILQQQLPAAIINRAVSRLKTVNLDAAHMLAAIDVALSNL